MKDKNLFKNHVGNVIQVTRDTAKTATSSLLTVMTFLKSSKDLIRGDRDEK